MDKKENKNPLKENPLNDLKMLLVDGTFEKTIEYEGHKYTFGNLTEEEECWKDRFIVLDTPLAMASSKRAPVLSISLRYLDGKPVLSLFPEMEELALTARDLKFAVAEKLNTEYFSKMKRDHITRLFALYVREIERPEEEAVKKVKNS